MEGQVGSGTSVVSRSESPLEDLSGKVHQLPCCVKYNGSTSVSHYFKHKPTRVEVDGLCVEEAYFRGRKLQGTTVSIPTGYSGYVLGKKIADKQNNWLDEESSCWEMNAEFKNMTLWNHDILPSKDDAFLRAFHWFPVADALHCPVSIEDLESASTDGTLV
ncbi:hypothetical protein LIER_06978 [Lithospermum erythrorhizon]|uniref:Uncharacterized protein n=1 Tax=Lithospermum erythrorhizon TaxID=34254 RepID=A0AAV3P6L1_LITER